MEPGTYLIPVAVVLLLAILTSVRVLWEYERGVVFRLGKLTRAKGPGMVFLLPFGFERIRKMDLRIVALDIPPQDTITKDNVSVTVNAVVYFRVVDPSKAVVEIEDYYFATSQLAQTTLRSVIGQSELDEILAHRERINDIMRDIIDQGTDPWGIEVTGVEIKDIDLPKEMKRAMAKQAETERERRAKVISAEGEFQASARLADAARIIQKHPIALQLRYLQTAVEIAAENNSTTIFPLPVDIFPQVVRQMVANGEEDSGSDLAEALESSGLDEALPEGTDREALAQAAGQALGLGAGKPSSAGAAEEGDEEEEEG